MLMTSTGTAGALASLVLQRTSVKDVAPQVLQTFR
jgi:hypothetical protein